MVRHEDVLHLVLENLSIGISKELHDLILLAISLREVAHNHFAGMVHFEGLELLPDHELVHELFVGGIVVERWCDEFLSPDGRISHRLLGEEHVVRLGVWVVDQDLVVVVLAETPWCRLVELEIDDGMVRVGRVRVKILALKIVPDQLLIRVSNRGHVGSAHRRALLGHTRLQTLVAVPSVQIEVVQISMVVSVISERLVESDEGVVHHVLKISTVGKLFHGNLNINGVMEGPVSRMVVVDIFRDAIFPHSATFSLLDTVLVNAPQVLYFLVDRLVIAHLGQEGGNDGPEGNVLHLQFENRCAECESGDLVEAERCDGRHDAHVECGHAQLLNVFEPILHIVVVRVELVQLRQLVIDVSIFLTSERGQFFADRVNT